MSRQGLRFFLDKQFNREVASMLRERGIDAVSARESNFFLDNGRILLEVASKDLRVLVTSDAEAVFWADKGFGHAGIFVVVGHRRSIGELVALLEQAAQILDLGDMVNSVEYV